MHHEEQVNGSGEMLTVYFVLVDHASRRGHYLALTSIGVTPVKQK